MQWYACPMTPIVVGVCTPGGSWDGAQAELAARLDSARGGVGAVQPAASRKTSPAVRVRPTPGVLGRVIEHLGRKPGPSGPGGSYPHHLHGTAAGRAVAARGPDVSPGATLTHWSEARTSTDPLRDELESRSFTARRTSRQAPADPPEREPGQAEGEHGVEAEL